MNSFRFRKIISFLKVFLNCIIWTIYYVFTSIYVVWTSLDSKKNFRRALYTLRVKYSKSCNTTFHCQSCAHFIWYSTKSKKGEPFYQRKRKFYFFEVGSIYSSWKHLQAGKCVYTYLIKYYRSEAESNFNLILLKIPNRKKFQMK